MYLQELLIATRYIRARRYEGGISAHSLISALGIAMAVFALVATLAVRQGFRDEFTRTIIGATPHLSLLPHSAQDEETSPIHEYEDIISVLSGHDEIHHAYAVVAERAMISFGNENYGTEVHGVVPGTLEHIPLIRHPRSSSGVPKLMRGQVAIGQGIATQLGVSVGDEVTLTVPNGVVTPFGNTPMIENFVVGYIFEVGRADVDRVRTFMSLDDAYWYFDAEAPNAIHMILADPQSVEAVQKELAGLLPQAPLSQEYLLWSWKEASSGFFSIMQLEDTAMALILGILLMIACLSISSGLLMLVSNKKHDIGILLTMGFSQGSILRIFIWCGLILGAAGTSLGLMLGAAFSINLNGFMRTVAWLMSDDMTDFSNRMIARLPDGLYPGTLLKVGVIALCLALVAAVVPARKAARLDPVSILQ